jgi:CheY-like chemotaxis protein
VAAVLIVDDDPQTQDYLKTLLDKAGYKVLLADDGESAMEMVVEHQPDLVLLDIMMPGAHGYSVCNRIKSNDITKRIKVIFLTAKSFPADKRQADQVGADGYLVKPVASEDLLKSLREHLGE